MRELKILAVVVALTLITYWGVEPFAHSQMHPHVDPANYKFDEADKVSSKQLTDRATAELAKAEESGDKTKIKNAKKDLEAAKAFETQMEEFWKANNEAIKLTGNAENGMNQIANCTGCHSIESQGFPKVMDDATAAASYGVVPPDLGSAGKIYTKEYLVAFIREPALAGKVSHKFQDGKMHPMTPFNWMPAQDIADIVAYLESIAPKEMTNKEVFQDACQRCHSIKYADMLKGTMASFTPEADIKKYMGKLPPDLSQYIRSRGASYLTTFINDPQKHLEGTAMPRVGLNEDSQKQVITYLEEVGDSKKPQRQELGPLFLVYLVIFAIFAFLWKKKMWREVH